MKKKKRGRDIGKGIERKILQKGIEANACCLKIECFDISFLAYKLY